MALAAVLAVSLTACGGQAEPTSSNAASGPATTTGAAETSSSDGIGDSLLESTPETTTGASQGGQTGSGNSGTTKADTNKTNKPTAPTPTKDPSDSKATLPKLDIKDKNITVCIDWSPESNWVKGWVSALNYCYPGMKITWKQATPDQKASKLAVWQKSGQSPDCIYVKPEESWPLLINNNLLEPIDEYIDIDSAFWGSAKGSMDRLKVNGHYYMMVSQIEKYGEVIYKKDLFTSRGMEDPIDLFYKDQWTWEKMDEYAKKLTRINASDPTKSTYGLYVAYGEPFIGTVGKDFISYDTSKKQWVSNLNDTGVKDAIAFITSLGATGNNYGPSQGDPTAIRNMVKSGQLGFYCTGEGLGLEFPEESKSGALVAVPFPRYDKSKTYYQFGVITAFCVPKGAKNPVGAVAFANAVRAYAIMDLKIPDDGTVEKMSTDEQDAVWEYASTKLEYVVMDYRRLNEGSDALPYYTLWGPGYLGGDSWSSVVAEQEPKILEALKKQ